MRRIVNVLVWATVMFLTPALAFAADGGGSGTGGLGIGAGLAVGMAGLGCGIGQGLTQGVVFGGIIGLVLVAMFYWYRSRSKHRNVE